MVWVSHNDPLNPYHHITIPLPTDVLSWREVQGQDGNSSFINGSGIVCEAKMFIYIDSRILATHRMALQQSCIALQISTTASLTVDILTSNWFPIDSVAVHGIQLPLGNCHSFSMIKGLCFWWSDTAGLVWTLHRDAGKSLSLSWSSAATAKLENNWVPPLWVWEYPKAVLALCNSFTNKIQSHLLS